MLNIFILVFVIFKSIQQDIDDDHPNPPKGKNSTSQDVVFNYEVDPNSEDFYPFYYQNDDNSSESSIHSNRILECSDHSGARNICSKANTSTLCYAKETYAFSFCRKSCRFCDPIDSIKHSYWRIVAGSEFKPTWSIAELKLYTKYPSKTDPLTITGAFASSQYQGFTPDSIFDDKNETYWIPSAWGSHQPMEDYIGVHLSSPSTVNAIRITPGNLEGNSPPTKLYVESASNLNDVFLRRWTVNIHENDLDNIIVKPLCPPLWKRLNSYGTTICVKIFGKHNTWEQAQVECRKHNANLISFENKEHLLEFTDSFIIRGPTWIGYNDIKNEGQFIWSDGSKSDFLNWEAGITTDELRNDDEDCVYIKQDGRFQTANCRDHFFFACHKPYEKFKIPEPDPREPDVFSPILTFPNDFSEPVLNTTESYNKLLNSNMSWPKAYRIPINQNPNQLYANRTNSLNKVVYAPQDVEDSPEFYPGALRNLPEKEKNEQPIHRVIEIKRRNLHKKNYKKHNKSKPKTPNYKI